MKTIIFLLFALPAFSQDVKTGRWSCNGVVITRTDSIQYEDMDGIIDSLQVNWIDSKRYTLTGAKTALFVTITKIRPWGYSGVISDGKRQKAFEFVNIQR
jgi:hypothetical protein